MELFWIYIGAMLINNFVLSYFLGLCPFFGVSGKLVTAFRLGLANIFVMVITSLCASFLNAVVVVTGRPAGWCDHLARMWPVAGWPVSIRPALAT